LNDESNEMMDWYLARSPIYSHLSASIQGVPLIRSYGAQAKCIQDFSHCLDEHSRVYSVMLGMNRWSGLRIECVVAAFVGLLAFSILIMHRSRLIWSTFLFC
jgi:ATP-binding cassette subfamily C (CFTR/MRP) protein 4